MGSSWVPPIIFGLVIVTLEGSRISHLEIKMRRSIGCYFSSSSRPSTSAQNRNAFAANRCCSGLAALAMIRKTEPRVRGCRTSAQLRM
jgi:hypothetical protein